MYGWLLSLILAFAAAPRQGPIVLVHGEWPAELRTELDEAKGVGSWIELTTEPDPDGNRIVLDLGAGPMSLSHADAARVREARVVSLHGGTWLEWWRALTPKGHEGVALRALRTAHRKGAWIVAEDAAAGYLAGGARIDHEAWDDLPGGRPVRRNPRRPAEGPVTLGGLGLAGDFLWARDLAEGQAVLSAGELERALVPIGNAAWIVDARGRARLHSGRALWLDARGARRVGDDLHGVLLADLRTGMSPGVRGPRRALDLTPGSLPPDEPGARWTIPLPGSRKGP